LDRKTVRRVLFSGPVCLLESKTKWEEKIIAAGNVGRANESCTADEHLEFVLKTILKLPVFINWPITMATNALSAKAHGSSSPSASSWILHRRMCFAGFGIT
jgi:hypothetical protein